MADRYAVDQNAAQWKSTGASAQDIAACDGRLECWTWYPFNDQPVALHATEGAGSDWEVRTEEPLGPADDALAAAHADAARALLVALLDALERGVPVVMAVPEDHFRHGSPLFALVDFARRALPGSLRKRCRIRCFVKDLSKYFGEFRADLLVIPNSLLTAAAGIRRDAVMLGADGQRISMEKERHTDYGRFVGDRLVKNPSTFPEFVKRLNRFIPSVPAAQQTNLIPLLGALTNGERNLEMPAGLEALDVDWRAAIEPGDWPLFTTASVYRMALNMEPVRAEALQEIERRKESPPAYVSWDEEVSKRPAAAVDALLASAKWQDWRDRTHCAGPELREAALHWCGSPYWRTHQPFLEDWVAVVRDLGPSLKAADLRVMAENGARDKSFPPIEFFEDRQARDLGAVTQTTARRGPDETVLLPVVETRAPVILFGASSEQAAKGSRSGAERIWKDRGVRAAASEIAGGTSVVILTEETLGPRQAMLLEPGSRPLAVAIEYPRSEIRLKPAQLLLLPASAEEEKRLAQFLDDLMLLSPEARQSLLAALPEKRDAGASPTNEEPDNKEESSGWIRSAFNWRKNK